MFTINPVLALSGRNSTLSINGEIGDDCEISAVYTVNHGPHNAVKSLGLNAGFVVPDLSKIKTSVCVHPVVACPAVDSAVASSSEPEFDDTTESLEISLEDPTTSYVSLSFNTSGLGIYGQQTIHKAEILIQILSGEFDDNWIHAFRQSAMPFDVPSIVPQSSLATNSNTHRRKKWLEVDVTRSVRAAIDSLDPMTLFSSLVIVLKIESLTGGTGTTLLSGTRHTTGIVPGLVIRI
jgi:hypothetical protein